MRRRGRAAFLFEQGADLSLCYFGEVDAVGRQFGGGFTHWCCPFVLLVAHVAPRGCDGVF